MGQAVQSKRCREQGERIRLAMISLLWDDNRGLFFECLNTPTSEELICDLMPQNVEKRYYRKHANILAAYFGVFEQEQCQEILEKVINDNVLGNVQPYFMHFLLEAIFINGLREKYTLEVLNEWKPSIRECSKGLPEGFYKPNDENLLGDDLLVAPAFLGKEDREVYLPRGAWEDYFTGKSISSRRHTIKTNHILVFRK